MHCHRKSARALLRFDITFVQRDRHLPAVDQHAERVALGTLRNNDAGMIFQFRAAQLAQGSELDAQSIRHRHHGSAFAQPALKLVAGKNCGR